MGSGPSHYVLPVTAHGCGVRPVISAALLIPGRLPYAGRRSSSVNAWANSGRPWNWAGVFW